MGVEFAGPISFVPADGTAQICPTLCPATYLEPCTQSSSGLHRIFTYDCYTEDEEGLIEGDIRVSCSSRLTLTRMVQMTVKRKVLVTTSLSAPLSDHDAGDAQRLMSRRLDPV